MRELQKGATDDQPDGALIATATRPHMKRREGETEDQWLHRLAHSCYRCGHYEADLHVLRDHEDSHGGHAD